MLLRVLFALIIFIILFLLFHKPLLSGYANFFKIENATKGADAIVLLAGNQFTRPYHAARLLEEGYAEQILLTDTRFAGIKKYPFMHTQGEVYKMVLEAEGYDKNISIIPSYKKGATSTLDEAVDFAAFARGRGFERVILVTDAFHTRRSVYVFTKIAEKAGLSITFEASPAKNRIYNTENWWRVEKGLHDYFFESIKYIMYQFIDTNITFIEQT